MTAARVLEAYGSLSWGNLSCWSRTSTSQWATADVRGSNRLVVTVAATNGNRNVRVVPHVDNLVQGAGRLGIENMNVCSA